MSFSGRKQYFFFEDGLHEFNQHRIMIEGRVIHFLFIQQFNIKKNPVRDEKKFFKIDFRNFRCFLVNEREFLYSTRIQHVLTAQAINIKKKPKKINVSKNPPTAFVFALDSEWKMSNDKRGIDACQIN
jgi:hypothetical protein